MIPQWAVEAVLDIMTAIRGLLRAQTDAERYEALMQAEEALKAARDRQKFGKPG